jgi:hypothetical protein
LTTLSQLGPEIDSLRVALSVFCHRVRGWSCWIICHKIAFYPSASIVNNEVTSGKNDLMFSLLLIEEEKYDDEFVQQQVSLALTLEMSLPCSLGKNPPDSKESDGKEPLVNVNSNSARSMMAHIAANELAMYNPTECLV